jgi:hypothetical protein
MVRHQIQRQERQGNNSDSSDNEDRRPSEDDHIVSAYNTTAYQEDSTEECQYQCYNDGRRHANEECQYDFCQPSSDDDNYRPSEDDHIVSAYNTTAYQEDPTEECQYQCYNDGRRHANEECQYDFGQPDEDDDHDSDDN